MTDFPDLLPQGAPGSRSGQVLIKPKYSMLQIHNYSDRAIAVTGTQRGDDVTAEVLRKTGGTFNPRLRCGPGWVFSKKHWAAVEHIVTAYNAQHDPQGTGIDASLAAYIEAQEEAHYQRIFINFNL